MVMIGLMMMKQNVYGKLYVSLKKTGPTWQKSLAKPQARLKKNCIDHYLKIFYLKYLDYSKKKKDFNEKGMFYNLIIYNWEFNFLLKIKHEL